MQRMSSELLEELAEEYADYIRSGEIEIAIGIGESIRIVKQHEAQQKKGGMNLRDLVNDEENFATPEEAEKLFIQAGYELKMKEPFYQLDEEQQNLLNELQIVSREIKCLDLDEVLDKCYHKRLVHEQLAILWASLDVIPKNQVFNAFTTWAIEQEKWEGEEAE